MLRYEDKEIKIYTTNNFLLVLDGDKIVKEMFIEEDCFLEDAVTRILEERSAQQTSFSHTQLLLSAK